MSPDALASLFERAARRSLSIDAPGAPMTRPRARSYLRRVGYSPARIARLERL
jgi:hypothetical protein